MMCLWSTLALAAPPEQPLPAHGEHVDLFSVEGYGQAFGGIAVVVHEGPIFALEALTPAGPPLFTVRVEGGRTTIDALDPGLGELLGRLPFDRDLAALYLVDGSRRLRVLDFRVRPRSDGWVVGGPRGRARVRREGEGLVLSDRLRGYRLTVTPLDEG